MNPNDPTISDSRRRFLRDWLALTGWTFLGGAELIRSATVAVAGDPKNPDPAWGGLKGRLLFDADVPERKEVDLTKTNIGGDDLKWFKSTGPILNEDWVIDPKSKAVRWVFVWLLPEDPKGAALGVHESVKAIPDKQKVVVADQAPTGYVPHAVGLRAGQDLVMRNTGPVAHVFNLTAGENNESKNVAMPPKTEIALKNVQAERTPLIVTCPPHPWEKMWLRVFDHPYFAVTAADGTFQLPLVPAGKCRLVVWQESLGFKGGRAGRDGAVVTVTGGTVTDLGDIKIQPKT